MIFAHVAHLGRISRENEAKSSPKQLSKVAHLEQLVAGNAAEPRCVFASRRKCRGTRVSWRTANADRKRLGWRACSTAPYLRITVVARTPSLALRVGVGARGNPNLTTSATSRADRNSQGPVILNRGNTRIKTACPSLASLVDCRGILSFLMSIFGASLGASLEAVCPSLARVDAWSRTAA